MDEEFVERRPGDLETYRRLDAFAHMRLAPSAVSMARIRESLVAEAAARARTIPDLDVAAHTVLAVSGRPWTRVRRVPRAIGGLLAATLTLGLIAGSVAASAAGGPLYGPRIWLESATLPTGAAERADAQVHRLDDRLAEVRSALAGNDPAATMAALEAYTSILAELEAHAMADPAVADRVRDDVSRHLAVLEALIGRVPPQAQAALQHALDRSDAAVDHLDVGGAGRPENPGSNGAGAPGGSGGSGGSGQGGGPDRTPQGVPPTNKPAKTESTPKATQKPAKTPKATEQAPKPAKTAAPEVAPTENPGRGPSSGETQAQGPS